MSEQLVEIWRGDMIESIHAGHAVVARASGEVVAAWGAPDTVIYPRSSCKMIQALPLIESGAAAAAGLGDEHLALACASHQGADIHTRRVGDWLSALGLSEADLLCGPQMPNDRPARDEYNGLLKAHRLKLAGYQLGLLLPRAPKETPPASRGC